MPKKYMSIFMLYTALALMLGHNFIGHHHHDFGHSEISLHHIGSHHHDVDTDEENDCDNWSHLFSLIHHGTGGLAFLTSSNSTVKLLNQTPLLTALHSLGFNNQQLVIDVREIVPDHISDYYDSQFLPSSGLRAPPIFVV